LLRRGGALRTTRATTVTVKARPWPPVLDREPGDPRRWLL